MWALGQQESAGFLYANSHSVSYEVFLLFSASQVIEKSYDDPDTSPCDVSLNALHGVSCSGKNVFSVMDLGLESVRISFGIPYGKKSS